MGVTLRKNYGSGFPFPLFYLAKKVPNKKSSTSLPHANNCKPTKLVLTIYSKIQTAIKKPILFEEYWFYFFIIIT